MKLCGFEAGNDQPIFLIAGTCVVESEQMSLDTAGTLKEICGNLGVNFIYKSSFDKANRSSAGSFRGPGMEEGLRILGEVKPEYARLLQLADDIFIEELHKQKLYDATSQAFAVFLPVKSVGVMGDGRRYDYVVALRAVETIDFMTARWARLPYEFLEHVSLRIINEVDGISRVTYDISGKPPATIEWE